MQGKIVPEMVSLLLTAFSTPQSTWKFVRSAKSTVTFSLPTKARLSLPGIMAFFIILDNTSAISFVATHFRLRVLTVRYTSCRRCSS